MARAARRLRERIDTSPGYEVQQNAYDRLRRARVALERHLAQPPRGHATQQHQPDDIQKVYERDTAEHRRLIAEAQREVDRVQALVRAASARRAALNALIEACRRWASEQRIALPGDGNKPRTSGRRHRAGRNQHRPKYGGGHERRHHSPRCRDHSTARRGASRRDGTTVV